jgi:protein ImuA
MPPRRSSTLTTAAPAPPASSLEALAQLRRRILAIERPKLEVRLDPDEEPGACGRPERRGSDTEPAAWSLGAPEADALIGAGGLDSEACHEIKPGSGTASSHAASLAFTLALARRRLDQVACGSRSSLPRILWCASPRAVRDMGSLYPPGLSRFGLKASSFLFIEARRDNDVLWALEEALRSGSLALAIGATPSIGLTPARRLSLAASEGATPLLFLTSARAPSSAATSTRWRIDPATSSVHPFDPRAPGAPRLAVRLERCRSAPPAMQAGLTLEWSDEAYRFRLAAALADRKAETAPDRRRTG